MRPSILAVAAVAATSLALGACGTGDADESSSGNAATGSLQTGPGVDAETKTIRVGDLNALSGPAAALGKPVAAGHQAYFDALNSRGGIDGWKVELAVEDTGYQPQQHVQAYNAIKGDRISGLFRREPASSNVLGSRSSSRMARSRTRVRL